MESRRALPARGSCCAQMASKLLHGWAGSWVLGKPLTAGEGRAALPAQLLAQELKSFPTLKTRLLWHEFTFCKG